jgi:hypothetical protein
MEQDNWKEKALERRLENKALKKRITELTLSRDSWKEKYVAKKEQSDYLENEMDKIKKKLNEILLS